MVVRSLTVRERSCGLSFLAVWEAVNENLIVTRTAFESFHHGTEGSESLNFSGCKRDLRQVIGARTYSFSFIVFFQKVCVSSRFKYVKRHFI